MVGDKVVLNPVNSGQPLHASSSVLTDHLNCQEVLFLFCHNISSKSVFEKYVVLNLLAKNIRIG